MDKITIVGDSVTIRNIKTMIEDMFRMSDGSWSEKDGSYIVFDFRPDIALAAMSDDLRAHIEAEIAAFHRDTDS